MIARFGIRSRNLNLFISQLSGKDTSEFLSGRDSIYPVVLEYLRGNGAFPSGFGVARKLTNGLYYHSHNFFLEMILILGFLGFAILIGCFFIKMQVLFKNRKHKNNKMMLEFIVILLSSFVVRSLTGTYFVTDVVFLTFLGIMLSIDNKGLKASVHKY